MELTIAEERKKLLELRFVSAAISPLVEDKSNSNSMAGAGAGAGSKHGQGNALCMVQPVTQPAEATASNDDPLLKKRELATDLTSESNEGQCSKLRIQEDDAGSRGPTSSSKQVTIMSYFHPQQPQISHHDQANGNVLSATTSPIGKGESAKAKVASSKPVPASSSTAISASKVIPNQPTSLTTAAALIPELRKQLDFHKQAKETLDSKVSWHESNAKQLQDKLLKVEEHAVKLKQEFERVLRETALKEARSRREKLAEDSVRICKLNSLRMNAQFSNQPEYWEDGYAMKELRKRTNDLTVRKDELEARKKKLTSWKRKETKKVNSAAGLVAGLIADEAWSLDTPEIEADIDLAAETEVVRAHLDQWKRDDAALIEETRALEAEKASHQKEVKRCQFEDQSRFFKDVPVLPCLHDRYLLQNLIGKGGFSEVWRAFDLLHMRDVAVKVHQLNGSWTEERKRTYVKHVTREYLIHRDICHPRIVQFFDVFEIDVNSFATVLEYCRGIDLDEKLKRHRTIPEKDAKAIILQILSGLRYLNTPCEITHPNQHMTSPIMTNTSNNIPTSDGDTHVVAADCCEENNVKPANHNNNNNNNNNIVNMPPPAPKRISIIHFDLKPANILFDEMGDAKITDFGLSKQMDESEGTSLELTSQGAGTYWYLPPECFDHSGHEPTRISSKVDVWSLGVIFYQMLFGKRPFGEGKTQERILSEGIVLKACTVDFPEHTTGPNAPVSGPLYVPEVSSKAKDFIRTCLTYDQKQRPDVIQLCQNPFLRK